jgi:hypothetical protein
MAGFSGTGSLVANFGQDSSFAGNKTAQGNQDSNEIGDFYYTPPTDFLALCTSNLPDVDITPSEHFNTVLWAGNGSTQSITGVGFQPDWVWVKERSSTSSNFVTDIIRGLGTHMKTDGTNAEDDNNAANRITSFDTDGFSVGTDGAYNQSSQTYVGWNWKAGGTGGTSHTQGTITSTASVNQDAGFSIVSYTGNGSDGATIGHGLSKAPEMVIFKDRDASVNWAVMGYPTHPAYSADGNMLFLNLAEAQGESGSNEISLGASTITLVDSGPLLGTSGNDYIAYCFHSVEGFSKCGKYEGNGSTDGTFVYTGFRPAYFLVKNTTTDGTSWRIYDNKRVAYNPVNEILYPDVSNAGTTTAHPVDFLSNGIKVRGTFSEVNTDGDTYLYLAFAETPFKYSNAR